MATARTFRHPQPLPRNFVLVSAFLSLLSTLVLLRTTWKQLAALGEEEHNIYFANYPKDTRKHTFRADDVPDRWPFETEKALLQVEETMHFAFNNTESDAEYMTLKESMPGLFRMDEEKHVVVPPVIHQLHCIHLIRDLLLGREEAYLLKGHDQHCLNLLRQWSLCRSDLTLERGDFTQRDFDVERQGAIHVCRDWTRLLEQGEHNWDDWARFWKQHHLERYLGHSSFDL